MALTVIDHAVARHLVTRLRNADTPPPLFRDLTRSLTHILVVEATRGLPLEGFRITTPLEETDGAKLAGGLVAVPVLRAGLGMLDAALDLLPGASVGYVGMQRDEKTAVATSYYCKLPAMEGAAALLLDPMLATGGSACWAADQLYKAGAASVSLVCVVAAPEGVACLAGRFPALHIVAAALDRGLNDRKFILPGLGDFGDRLYGT